MLNSLRAYAVGSQTSTEVPTKAIQLTPVHPN